MSEASCPLTAPPLCQAAPPHPLEVLLQSGLGLAQSLKLSGKAGKLLRRSLLLQEGGGRGGKGGGEVFRVRVGRWVGSGGGRGGRGRAGEGVQARRAGLGGVQVT